ncbi:MAG TPA: PspC domain-containing protein [Dermatophilaceae bacterium]|nr:PspC domain-containing protein [Dermatophilaceae bacterium]
MNPRHHPVSDPATVHRRMIRPGNGRVLVGVCASVAEHLRIPVRVVRWAVVALCLFGGAGVVAYLLLWVMTPSGDGLPLSHDVHGAQRRVAGLRPAVRILLAGFALLAFGTALAIDRFGGISVNLGTVFPIVAVAGGAVLAWSNLDDAERRSWLSGPQVDSRRSFVRIGFGIVLALCGILVLATREQGWAMTWDVTVSTLIVLAGLVIILAPWVMRFWARLQQEQAIRIREQERADIAAHLHDSVLQTLALIQRTEDPSRVAQLARSQERELRSWLYGGTRVARDTLTAAVTDAVHEIEDLHVVPVDLVVTGDQPLDEIGEALVAAVREAVLNAVRHARPPISAYVEVGPERVEAFVRDHGAGFDPGQVPADRLGVRESILGRMVRHGGTAEIRSLDAGTEVRLCLPVSTLRLPDRPPAGDVSAVDAGGAR